jgi:hypothetical protein
MYRLRNVVGGIERRVSTWIAGIGMLIRAEPILAERL